MATQQEIGAAIRAGTARVTQVFGALSDEQLAAQVHAGEGGWTAKQILAHLAGRQAGYDRMIGMAESGASWPADFNVDTWNQSQVDARVDKSRDELLAEFLTVHAALLARAEGMTDAELARTLQLPRGAVPLGDVLRMSGGLHAANHAVEVEQALGTAPPATLAMPGQTALGHPFASLHHVALVTSDMKKTVAFYRDVLGSEVAMGHRLQRPGNERHYFITVTPTTVFAFFEFPDAEMPAYKDATLPSTGRHLDHIAFFAADDAQFHRWYERLTEAKVDNLSPIRQMGPGLGAFFFADPNGIVLEVMAPPKGDGMRVPILDDADPAY